MAATAGALIAAPKGSAIDYEGFVVSHVNGYTEYHWIRILDVDPLNGSPAHSRLEVAASLEQLLGGAAAIGPLCARLRGSPSVQHFLEDLQEVIERLAYGSSAGPGPGSVAGSCSGGRHGAPLSSPSCSSHAVMRSLLADLDRLGWGCLEELDQDAARLTLLHRDMRGREHRLRLTLPPDYPASPPAAATDLPTPLEFRWLPQQAPLQQHAAQWRAGPAGGVGGGGGGAGEGAGVCSSIAHVFEEFKQLILRLQPLWAALEELDRRTRVLDPPPSLSAARRHLAAPARRLALGGAASLQLRLEAGAPRAPPQLPGGVAFLGPPEVVGELREGFFERLHLWSEERGLVDNLELLLGQQLPPPSPLHHQEQQHPTTGAYGSCDAAEGEPLQAECPICMMHLLPLPDGDGGEDGEGEDAAGQSGDVGAMAAGGGCSGLVPDVVCPTPQCALAFHSPCLAEWLRSLPDTRVSFSRLFGRCPFCSNPITVRA